LISVKHQPNNLLRQNLASSVPEELKNTFVAEVTYPVHKAMLQLLNTKVIREHATEKNLAAILESWPEYVAAHGVNVKISAKNFKQLRITQQHTITAASGINGNFEIASIKRL
jgi:hypothetical protein